MRIPLTTRDRATTLDVTVTINDPATPIGDVGTELGLGQYLTIDGRPVDPALPVSGCGLSPGVVLERARAVGEQRAAQIAAVVTLVQIAGLAAGGSVDLPAGRHTVGATGPARSELRLGTVAATRFLIDVSPTARVVLHAQSSDQVAVDGVTVHGSMEIRPDHVIDVGGTAFRLGPTPQRERRTAATDGRITLRPMEPPRILPPPAPVAIPSLAGLARRELKAVHAGNHPVFGQFEADLAAARREATDYARAAVADVGQLRDRVARADSNLWVHAGHGPLQVMLGFGNMPWPGIVETRSAIPEELQSLIARQSQLTAVPLGLDLQVQPGGITNLAGPRHATLAVARWLVLQLASRFGPDSLAMTAVCADPLRWDWMKWLPHSGTTNAELEVIVLDGRPLAELPAGRTRLIIRLLSDIESARHTADRVVVHADGHLALHGIDGLAIGLTESTAQTWARSLAPLSAPIPVVAEPPQVWLDELCGLRSADDAAAEVRQRWATAAVTPRLMVSFGAGANGPTSVDLGVHRHVVIAGPTKSGRSTTLNVLALALAAQQSPQRVDLVLVDAGGEGTFRVTGRLPHVRANLGGNEGRALLRLLSERPERPTVVLIDDATMLCAAHPAIADALARASEPNGRFHLVLSSRRPDALLAAGILPVNALRIDLSSDDGATSRLLFGTSPLSERPVRPGQARCATPDGLVTTVQIAAPGAIGMTPQPNISTSAFLQTDRRRAARIQAREIVLEPMVNAVIAAAVPAGWPAPV